MAHKSFSAGLAFLAFALASSAYASDDFYNSERINSSQLNSPRQIYDLEEQLIEQFKGFKEQALEQTDHEHKRNALKASFDQLRELQAFKENYVSFEARNHIFHVPSIMLETADSPQIKRLRSGKAFVSPTGKTSFQGHHTNQEDAIDENNPAHVWLLTKTNHKAHHSDLHVPVEHSHVNRNTFAGAKREVYKREVATEAEKKKLKRSILDELNAQSNNP